MTQFEVSTTETSQHNYPHIVMVQHNLQWVQTLQIKSSIAFHSACFDPAVDPVESAPIYEAGSAGKHLAKSCRISMQLCLCCSCPRQDGERQCEACDDWKQRFRSFLGLPEEDSPVEVVLLSRNDPDIEVDEVFFLGGIAKNRVLEELKPHIFFDDQVQHITGVRRS
jgi:hypothetical protein